MIILQGCLHLPDLPFYGKSELSLLPKIYLRIVLHMNGTKNRVAFGSINICNNYNYVGMHSQVLTLLAG